MSAEWVDLVGILVWPVVVAILVGGPLRRPIATFLSSIGGRISSVTVLDVSIELATAADAAPSWRATQGRDLRGLVPAAEVSDSFVRSLQPAFADRSPADYFVVDLKKPKSREWLTSRLYLFTYLLHHVKGVHTVVFTGVRDGMGGIFLGLAPVDRLLDVLGEGQPLLRLARIRTEAQFAGPLPPEDEDEPIPTGPAGI